MHYPLSVRPADPTVTVIVPAYNEARNLEVVLPSLPEVHEVLVVDGGSVDDTRETVDRIMPEARFIQQTRRGKGNALACGMAAASGDIVVLFDADGSADPTEIDRMVEALCAGADFVKGSRHLPGGGSTDLTPLRTLGNRALTGTVNRLFGTRYTDLCYGYNALWRHLLPALRLPDVRVQGEHFWGDGFEIETLMNCRVADAGLKVAEVPSYELPRIHGSSNLHAVTDGLRVLRTILVERFRTPATTEATSAPAGRLEQLETEHAA